MVPPRSNVQTGQIDAAWFGDGCALVQIVGAEFLLIDPGADEFRGGHGVELKGQDRFGLNEFTGGGGDDVI